MSKVSIIGNAVVITSAIALEDIKLMSKVNPESLKLYEGEGDKKSLEFVVATGTNGDAGSYGIIFNGVTRDDKKCATVTIMHNDMPAENDKAKDFVADKYGTAVIKLTALEEKLAADITAAKAAHKAMVESITIA